MKNLKICHVDGLKQGNTPICGIYAFINGFYDGRNTEDWMALINYLWNLSIDGNLRKHSKNNTYSIAAHDLTYSTVGEFFSSDNLYSFLNSNKKSILPELQKLIQVLIHMMLIKLVILILKILNLRLIHFILFLLIVQSPLKVIETVKSFV